MNKFMGPDGILGKAKRKLLKAAHDQMTGTTTPEGDVTDGDTPVVAVAEPSKPTFSRPEPKANGAETTPAVDAATRKPADPAPLGALNSTAEPASAPEESDARRTLSGALENVPFDAFRRWLINTDRCPDADSLGSMDELPLEVVKQLLADPAAIKRCLTLCAVKKEAK